MKLYIPTCTLNFNNIFSTESISPIAFYSKRSFGNKRFEKVEANKLDNLLVLYSKFPFFEIEDKGIDNYPMVIEIETDTISNKPVKINSLRGIDIYVSASTIYLNPFSTMVYFNDNHALSIVRLRSEQSIENKMFNIYKNNYRIKEVNNKSFFKSLTGSFLGNNEDCFKWNKSYIENIKDENNSKEDEIEKDRILNQVKGFAYCYLIGANISSNEEISQLKQLARKINNTLSAIVNSPERRATKNQNETLLADIKNFNRVFTVLNDAGKYNQIKIENYIRYSGVQDIFPNLTIENIFDILEKLQLKKDLMYKCGIQRIYDAFDIYECLNSPLERIAEHSDRAIRILFNEVVKLESQQKALTRAFKIEELFDISATEININGSNNPHNYLYKKLINKLIHDEYKRIMYQEDIKKETAIAFMGGSILKDHMGDKWEHSSTQEYVNKLLSHLHNGTTFDLNSTNNSILISFAAFVQKGEDIERLTDYLVQRGISDYKLAYGLYGATEGFASLPKTVTNKLFNGNNIKYISEVYKKIYQSCTGTEINAELPMPTKNEFFREHKTRREPEKSDFIKTESNTNFPKSQTPVINEIRKNVPEFNSMVSEAILYYTEQINKVYFDKLDIAFMRAITEIEPLPKTKGKWEKVIAYLKKKQKENTEKQNKLFNDSQSLFVEDENAYLIIDKLSSINKDIKKNIITNLKHIQKEYLPGGYYDNRRNPRDNENVINHFVKWCFSDKNKYARIPKTTENQECLSRLQELLNSIYK